MSDEGSVTLWLEAVRQDDTVAANELWRRYFHRLQGLARRRLGQPRPPLPFDSQDVALSAFGVFFRLMQDGKFPDLAGRDELWPLLARITLRKAKDYVEKEQAQKRSAGREDVELEKVVGDGPPPDVEAMMAEECQRMLDRLEDPALEKVALWKLDGWTNDEIARELKYTRRTVQRMLNVIRMKWENEVEGGEL